MPRLKKDYILLRTEPQLIQINYIVHVNSSGEFYCAVPEELKDYLHENINNNWIWTSMSHPSKKWNAYARSLEDLKMGLTDAAKKVFEPKIEETNVILYNIESRIAFATDSDGKIFPNSGYPGASWPKDGDRNKYGNISVPRPSQDGYQLIIGAKAYSKRTISYGEVEKIKYEPYYGEGGNHLGKNNPAEILNSWTSFSLNKDNVSEIPYSDEAAIFFNELMLGMAKISKIIQDNTFDKNNLLNIINSGNKLLGEIK